MFSGLNFYQFFTSKGATEQLRLTRKKTPKVFVQSTTQAGALDQKVEDFFVRKIVLRDSSTLFTISITFTNLNQRILLMYFMD